MNDLESALVRSLTNLGDNPESALLPVLAVVAVLAGRTLLKGSWRAARWAVRPAPVSELCALFMKELEDTARISQYKPGAIQCGSLVLVASSGVFLDGTKLTEVHLNRDKNLLELLTPREQHLLLVAAKDAVSKQNRDVAEGRRLQLIASLRQPG